MTELTDRYQGVPFQQWAVDKLRTGKKTATCRYTQIGRVGERFTSWGMVFELTRVTRYQLDYVAGELFRQEGCINPTQFEERWHDIYGRYDGTEWVWYHEFRRIRVAEKDG